MSCLQITGFGPCLKFSAIPSSQSLPDSQLRISPISAIQTNWGRSRRLSYNAPSYKICTPVCQFGGKGKSENDNEGSPWKSLEKAMGGFRKDQSVQDILRDQMREQTLNDDGSGAGSPPGAGGDGSGGSEDEGLSGILDELLQVILATIGFIFLYTYIITGEEITRLVKDYITYLFRGKKSVRLRRAMYEWGKLYQDMTRKEVVDEYWLEKAILNTPTWWYSPIEFKRYLGSRLASASYR